MEEINYFGTSLDTHGHYFWILDNDTLRKSEIWFSKIPFNPEDYRLMNGETKFEYVEDYSILRIGGSCYDKRGGCKSVFFIKEILSQDQMFIKLRNTPIFMEIINQMPFKVVTT